MRGALVEGIAQERPSADDLATIERFEALVHERLRDSLLLGLSASGPIDIGARSIVGAIEKEHARPQVDGGIELTREIVIEPGDEQMLDAALVFGGQGV